MRFYLCPGVAPSKVLWFGRLQPGASWLILWLLVHVATCAAFAGLGLPLCGLHCAACCRSVCRRLAILVWVATAWLVRFVLAGLPCSACHRLACRRFAAGCCVCRRFSACRFQVVAGLTATCSVVAWCR